MGKSNIPYISHVWNVLTGCQGKNCAARETCYARRMVKHRPAIHGYRYKDLESLPIHFNEVVFHPDRLSEPLKRKKPTVWGVGFFGDMFDEQVTDDWLIETFNAMRQCPRHRFVVLTKQPKRMADLTQRLRFDGAGRGRMWLEDHPDDRNGYRICGGYGCTGMDWVWYGTTVNTQAEADERIPELLKVPGKKWLSLEPCLSDINLLPYLKGGNKYDRKGNSIHGSSGPWCVQCGHRRKCLEAWQNDRRGEIIVHQDVQCQAESGCEHKIGISDDNFFPREAEKIRSGGSPSRMDDSQPCRNPPGNGDKPQGRGKGEPPSFESGIGNEVPKCRSFIADDGQNEQAREEGLFTKIDRERRNRYANDLGSRRDYTESFGETLQDSTNNRGPHPPQRVLEGSPIGLCIVGGESGPKARPMHPQWARDIRDQCAASGTPFYFKQWGKWRPSGGYVDGNLEPATHGVSRGGKAVRSGKLMTGEVSGQEWDGYAMMRGGSTKAAGRLLDGVLHDNLPWRRP